MSSTATTITDADYLQISGITAPFKLTGQSVFSWTGTTTPKNSQLAYQIKVVSGATQSVPEPSTVGALIVASGMIAGAKRKK